MYKLYRLDEYFFEKVNPINSWVAGWILSDGYIYLGPKKVKYVVSLGLAEQDKYIVEKIKDLVNFDGPIKILDNSKGFGGCNAQKLHKIRINSKKWVFDLQHNFNIKGGGYKSFDSTGPILNLSYDCKLALIQGSIEGDGSFMILKNGNNKITKSTTPQISIIGSYNYLSWFKDFCDKNYNKSDHHFNGIISDLLPVKKCPGLYTYGISGLRAVKLIIDMYKLPTPKMPRKWSPQFMTYLSEYIEKRPEFFPNDLHVFYNYCEKIEYSPENII